MKFVSGERYATINVHYLLHLTDAVADLGPLWANTCFEFENANGIIKKLFHGTRKIDMQVSNYIHVHNITYYNADYGVYCNNSICSSRTVSNNR